MLPARRLGLVLIASCLLVAVVAPVAPAAFAFGAALALAAAAGLTAVIPGALGAREIKP